MCSVVFCFSNWLTVGGIRSTGVSGCLALARYVHHLLLMLDGQSNRPTHTPAVGATRGQAIPFITDKVSAILDGSEYTVTHPLMKLGMPQGFNHKSNI